MRQYVCEWNALLERKKLRIQVGNRAILVAVHDGVPHAIADKCPHLGFPLSGGVYQGGIIRCKEHGLEVDVRTGTVVDSPKAAFLKVGPDDRTVRTFSVTVENGKVFVEA